MADAAASRLKAELKRSLRKRVWEVVNDVCDEFEEALKPPTTLPQMNEVDYECCRRLVEYIVCNMDTSPKFAVQMDCVILAYQSNAPVEVLNSVVTQNLWVRRKGLESSPEKIGGTDGQAQMKAVTRSTAMAEMELTGGCDVPKSAASVVAAAASLNGEMTEGRTNRDSAEARPAAVATKNSKHEHADNNKRQESGFHFADIMKGTALVVAKTSKWAASKRRTPPLQKAHLRLSPRNPFAGLGEVGSVSVVSSRNATVKVKTSPSDTGSRLLTKKAKPHSARTNAPQLNEPVDTTDSKNVQVNTSVAVTSRPREWGKRKRLVTSKQPKAAAATSKRARRVLPKHFESSDLSSTETENSEDEKARAVKQTHSGEYNIEDQRISSKVANALKKTMITKTRKPGVVVTASNVDSRTTTIAAQETKAVTVQKKASGTETPAISKNESKIRKAGEQSKAKAAKQVITANDHGRNAAGEGGENNKGNTERANAQVGIETLRLEDEQSEDEELVDAELCQVERDLAAGDESDELEAAKRSFQAMLNAVVGHQAIASRSTVLSESNSNEKARAVADPIGNLCDAAQRSPYQTCNFKMRLRDTISIVDALLCKPPCGHSCTRDCKTIRAQMCNEFTPCINPTCRTWHEAETHSESCPDNQCEFKTRVVLRETMHLIEHKQQEFTKACDALELANAALLSPTRRSSKERFNAGNAKAFERIERLQNELQLMNAELANLIDMKMQHLTTLNGIGIASNSDNVDEFPDFASHYTIKSRRRKKA